MQRSALTQCGAVGNGQRTLFDPRVAAAGIRGIVDEQRTCAGLDQIARAADLAF